MKRSHSSGQGYLDQITHVLARLIYWSQPAHPKPSAARTPKIRNSIHSMIGLESLEARPVLILSRSDAMVQVSEWIVDAGFWVAHSQSIQKELESLRPDMPKWSVILIAIDDFGGITDVIEDLLQLRRAQPGLPVILLSSEVQGDDFSSVRKHVCDATLRLPVSLPRLNLALCESLVNNLEWVDFSEKFQSRSAVFPKGYRFNGFTQHEV
ncbi:hypothetical protein [Pseudotabrizicola alkalilacus]|nr:hypothetical protein [Pseudotabrizicola alkalilacus]